MDECKVDVKNADDCSKESLKDDKTTLNSKNNDEEFKDLEDSNDLNGHTDKNLEEVENQLNDLSLNNKTSKRLDDDASEEEEEYYDITSDNSNVDSEELSSLPDQHKSLNELNNVEIINDDLEDKLHKSEDEREQGDGEEVCGLDFL